MSEINEATKENPRRGRPSGEDITGEEMIEVKAKITRSMYEYLEARPGFSMAGFIRYLIWSSMQMRDGVASGKYDIDALPVRALLEEGDKWNRAFEEIFGIEESDEE